MSDSDAAREWLRYALENLQTARLTLESDLYNPCLQNCQQAVEKSLEGLALHCGVQVMKTHSSRDLNRQLSACTGGSPLDDAQ